MNNNQTTTNNTNANETTTTKSEEITMQYKLTKETSTEINDALNILRAEDRDFALTIRKVYNNLNCKVFTSMPYSGEDLVAYYNGNITDTDALHACNFIINLAGFEAHIEEVIDIPEIELDEETEDRFAFMDELEYSEMDAHQLSLVLFKDLSTELEMSILSMNTGLKMKYDLLDELKDHIKTSSLKRTTALGEAPTRIEVLEGKLANVLALVKLDTGKSSLVLKDGRLLAYEYLTDKRKTDVGNLGYLANMREGKTNALDVFILEATFKAYKEEVAKGTLPVTSREFNMAVAKVINGVEETTEATKKLVEDAAW